MGNQFLGVAQNGYRVSQMEALHKTVSSLMESLEGGKISLVDFYTVDRSVKISLNLPLFS